MQLPQKSNVSKNGTYTSYTLSIIFNAKVEMEKVSNALEKVKGIKFLLIIMSLPWKKVYLVGIGGAGMTAIAQLLNDAGVEVVGSDISESKNTQILKNKNINVFIEHQEAALDSSYDLVIYSAAIKENNPVLSLAIQLKILTISRGLFLPLLAKHFRNIISIAGSHGKSTVTSLIVHLCLEQKIKVSYLIGAQPNQFPSGCYMGSEYLVLESDESDGSFAEMNSDIAVINNADSDHDWNIGGKEKMMELFKVFAKQSQKLFVTKDTPFEVYDTHSNSQLVTLNQDINSPLYGEHNQLNASVAYSVVKEMTGNHFPIEAFQTFKGLKRRMSTIYSSDDYIIIEDYAHHPKELSSCIDTIFSIFPDYNVQLVFQPHRNERVKKHMSEFISIFNQLHQVYITPTFGAWTESDSSISWTSLSQIRLFSENDWQQIAKEVFENRKAKTLTLVVGAATVENIIPHLQQLILQEKDITPVNAHLSWKEITTASIGGTIPYFYQPKNLSELKKLFYYIHQLNLPYQLVCYGSNLIGVDDNYSGCVVQLKGDFQDIKINGNKVTVGAGVRLTRLVKALSDNNLGGGEVLIAIPGGVGGSIRMNAGAQGKEISDFLVEIQGILPDGKSWVKKVDEISWRYRGSDIPKNVIITEAELQFFSERSEQSKEKIERTRQFRKNTQPGGKNAGCTFVNPLGDSSGRLIDKYGLKNTFVGDCIVSNKHGNFFINQGNATVKDLKNLINTVRQKVFVKSGIILGLENIFVDDWQPKLITPYTIVVLKGGISSEREISLKTGSAIAQALKSSGHQVLEIDITEAKLPNLPSKLDIVFIALHGCFGEDGQIQRLLNEKNIPFIGCDEQASSLMINKYETNEFLRKHNFSCPWSISIESLDAELPSLSFPVIVKPQKEGSTIGLTLVKNQEQLVPAMQLAFQSDSKIMIEEFIKGVEVTVGLLHGKALPVVEIIPPNEIFDYEAKYAKGKITEYLCPAKNISKDIQKEMQTIAERIFKLTKAQDILRVDMIYRPEDRNFFILEINNLPGFTDKSLLPMAAKNIGVSFSELCSLIVHKKIAEIQEETDK